MKIKDIQFASSGQMIKLDQFAVEHKLLISQMMEMAGYRMLDLFDELNINNDAKVLIVVGKGNKGGDGLCAARHLLNHGFDVSVILMKDRNEMSDVAIHQLILINQFDIPIIKFADEDSKRISKIIESHDVVIDALIGYRLDGDPRGSYQDVIKLINEHSKKTIAYDIATGLDCDDGEIYSPCIKADITLTLALPKRSLLTANGAKMSGSVYLGDVGIPSFVYKRVNESFVNPFVGIKKGLLKII